MMKRILFALLFALSLSVPAFAVEQWFGYALRLRGGGGMLAGIENELALADRVAFASLAAGFTVAGETTDGELRIAIPAHLRLGVQPSPSDWMLRPRFFVEFSTTVFYDGELLFADYTFFRGGVGSELLLKIPLWGLGVAAGVSYFPKVTGYTTLIERGLWQGGSPADATPDQPALILISLSIQILEF